MCIFYTVIYMYRERDQHKSYYIMTTAWDIVLLRLWRHFLEPLFALAESPLLGSHDRPSAVCASVYVSPLDRTIYIYRKGTSPWWHGPMPSNGRSRRFGRRWKVWCPGVEKHHVHVEVWGAWDCPRSDCLVCKDSWSSQRAALHLEPQQYSFMSYFESMMHSRLYDQMQYNYME